MKFQKVAPAQIYIFTLYPGPKFTQPTFPQNPQLHNTKFTHDPNIHEPKFTPPQIYITQFYTNSNIHSHKITPNPNLHRSKFTEVPILHNQGTRYFPSLFLAVQTFSLDQIVCFCNIVQLAVFNNHVAGFSKGLLKKCVSRDNIRQNSA